LFDGDYLFKHDRLQFGSRTSRKSGGREAGVFTSHASVHCRPAEDALLR